jgi:tRNA pseudouridine55 synthase
VRVEHLTVIARDEHRLELEVGVSKGYYVRSLARDLGATLGVPAHLAELRRTASGSFSIGEAVSWPALEPPPLLDLAISAERALPITRLSPEGARKARLGQLLDPDDASSGAGAEEASCWLAPTGEVVAVGCRTEGGFRVIRGFSTS